MNHCLQSRALKPYSVRKAPFILDPFDLTAIQKVGK